MRVRTGDTIKVADIGTLGKVIKTGKNSVRAEFNFPEGNVEVSLPTAIITRVVKEHCYVSARI